MPHSALRTCPTEFVLISIWVSLSSAGCTAGDRGFDAPTGFEIERVSGLLQMPEGFEEGRILVAGDPGEPPAACDLEASVGRVRDLFTAITSGDGDIVSRFFPVADPEAFLWYSMAGPGDNHFDTKNLDRLGEHWDERVRSGERLELRGIQINRWDDDLAHFGPLLAARWAADLAPGLHVVIGKTTVDCKTGKIVVMSLVTDPEGLPFVE